jgi:glutamate dehydrogenase/leucine dehydrogenase
LQYTVDVALPSATQNELNEDKRVSYVDGANIAGFVRVADAMQGVA